VNRLGKFSYSEIELIKYQVFFVNGLF